MIFPAGIKPVTAHNYHGYFYPMTNPAATEWLAMPLGKQLLGAEAELMRGLLDDVFGLEMLQLGVWGSSRDLLSASRVRRQTVISASQQVGIDIVAQLHALPIQTASVDAVLLPHTLEFAADPHAIVREADRVLTGEGQIIILGFHSRSLWGLRSAASRTGFPAGLQRMLTLGRVRDWLLLLGYEVVLQKRYLYSRPWGDSSEGPRRILRRGLMNPLPAAAWILKARKHVYRMTPLRHRFVRERRRVLGALPEPTTRQQP
jgi:SAM-dependent methyltransferase